jgi:hypothetical protein
MRSLRARIGGFATASRNDLREYTSKARAASPGSLAYFERQVDPQNQLPEAERERRARAAQKLHFARLAAKSAQVRQARKALVAELQRQELLAEEARLARKALVAEIQALEPLEEPLAEQKTADLSERETTREAA